MIDSFDMHMDAGRVDPSAEGLRVAARLHGVGDIKRYNTGWPPSSSRSSTTTGRACEP